MQSNDSSRRRLFLHSLAAEEPQKMQNISANGSLVLSQFRLNSKGLTFTKNITYMESQHFKDLKLDDFEIVCKLGQGNYGSVEKVLHKPTQDYYALKKIHYVSNDIQESLLKKELKALIDCNSQYVVQCYGAFYSKGEIYIVMEYMDMGSLQIILEKTKKIPESITMLIIKEVLQGLDYLHTNKHIIHRDIKPHNILINKKGEVKIGDFGICSVSENSDQKFDTFIGTIQYMSPERLNGEEYGYDCDIWSVGMMTMQCITGLLPFEFDAKKMSMIEYIQMSKNFKIDEYFQQHKHGISENTILFISKCLQQEPKHRTKAQELLQTKAIKYTQSLKIDVFKQWLQLSIEEI
ncbi:unnamed protein product [Paramecium sonneborni]|uniref:Protein kinase domain-containing protein n=1 Tax=Paramecium sonneborni TaxID=65129 RepID=A0A8S1R197_9CILI|nr:unnamed protein product [Paramecium sonneborni]